MELLKYIFVPYEIAVQLKEIGFYEPCVFYYDSRKELLFLTLEKLGDKRVVEANKIWVHDANCIDVLYYSAPTYEQVFKWFRDIGLSSSINPRIYGDLYFYEIFINEENESKRSFISNENLTYEDCREQLIFKLIETWKKQ